LSFKRLRSVFNPDIYHGWGKKRSYFEGWYFKAVNSDSNKIFAIIPGVSFSKEGESHSFIQVLDGISLKSEYFKFEINDFRARSDRFELEIGNNLFRDNFISLNLPGFSGELMFENLQRWPGRWYSPGIMGPYTFVPFMECYHGIVSMDHSIRGIIMTNAGLVDFEGGRGYIEKDWGRSFPEAYIWLQSNHFKDSASSIKVSIARIPWLGSSFTGFIAGLLHDGRLYEFTSYNSSKLEMLNVSSEEISIVFSNRKVRIRLKAERDKPTLLSSPVSGGMYGHISESMKSLISISLEEKHSGKIIYSDRAINTALEVDGDTELLIK
jgi:tocopherol cyclase